MIAWALGEQSAPGARGTAVVVAPPAKIKIRKREKEEALIISSQPSLS
jgi:hypothetical protein